MKECCDNCSLCFKLEKWDYSKMKTSRTANEWITEQKGYICMLFADDRKALWLVGSDPKEELCECFTRRE